MNRETLINKLLEASNEIHKRSLKGGADYLYLSSKVFHLFSKEQKRINKIKKILENV